MRRHESRAADAAVLAHLDVPRTTREVLQVMREEVWEAWAEREGYQLDYTEERERKPVEPGVRLLAHTYARDLTGFPMLDHAQVYNRLVKLEKAGLVHRLMLPHHSRSVLWFRPRSTTAEGLS